MEFELNDSGQAVHILVFLSLSNIIWYRSTAGDALLWAQYEDSNFTLSKNTKEDHERKNSGGEFGWLESLKVISNLTVR